MTLSAQGANPFDKGGTQQVSAPNTQTIQEEIPVHSEGEYNPFEKTSPAKAPISSSQSATERPTVIKPTKAPKKDTKLLVLIYCIAMIVIMTLAISLDKKRFFMMLQSLFNSNNLKTLYRDKPWTNGQDILLYIGFFFNAAFALWLYLIKTDTHVNLFLLLGGMLAIYVVRHVSMWVIEAVYPVGPEVGLQSYSIALHNMCLGLFMLLMILCLEFLAGIGYVKIGLAILFLFGVFYLLRQTKGLFWGLNMRGLNPLYFFIYLCALEITPFLVAYKLLLRVV